MKKYTAQQLISILAVPVLTVVLGLILLFSPDTASALLGKLLGWVCVLGGAFMLFRAAAIKPPQTERLVLPLVCLAAGIWLLVNPLILAKLLGRALGLILLIRGARNLSPHLQSGKEKPEMSPALVTAGITALLGLLLILLPMATSRLVFSVAGVVIICVGIADGFDRLQGRKQLDEGEDPNIIDVEKV